MSHRRRFLRRQIAIYRRTLKQVENLALWEHYEGLLDEALRELKALEAPNPGSALPGTPIERLRELVKPSATGTTSSRVLKTPVDVRPGN